MGALALEVEASQAAQYQRRPELQCILCLDLRTDFRICHAGWGAVENTAKVHKGATVAVFGAGVIGLAVIEVCFCRPPGRNPLRL